MFDEKYFISNSAEYFYLLGVFLVSSCWKTSADVFDHNEQIDVKGELKMIYKRKKYVFFKMSLLEIKSTMQVIIQKFLTEVIMV